ncbi:PA2779 family protein [Desulfuromonas sp. TF]|uniref:PA2779 family protein n=1 Tax=Desulfuromonas sp. TF TaxID=1232410 RepID=UPI00041DD75B|nr:PA2779 family protein [Desulfuromonas sp. TF]
MYDRSRWVLDIRICWMVLFAFCCLSLIPANGSASLIESRLSGGESLMQREAEIETIRQTLEREVVVQRLADYGLSPEEVSAKLPTLSDEQLHQLASLSESLGEGGILGAVIAILVIVLLVIVILKVTDKQVIVK